MPRTTIVFLVIGIFIVGFSLTARAQSPYGGPWRKHPAITVVSGENDPRIPLVDEAVAFWNDQFVRIGSAFRLGGFLPLTSDEKRKLLEMYPPDGGPSHPPGKGDPPRSLTAG